MLNDEDDVMEYSDEELMALTDENEEMGDRIVEESKEKIADLAPLNQIKVLSFKEKNEWRLESKYNIGRKKQESD